MLQLIFHLWGDYIFQSDWMANNKTSSNVACLAHVCAYSFLFWFIAPSWIAFAVIFTTHFFIDRFRLAKYVVYAKQFLAPSSVVWKHKEENIHPEMADEFVDKYTWENCKATGYPSETPPWMAVWLMIIADNCLHLTINYLAIRFL